VDASHQHDAAVHAPILTRRRQVAQRATRDRSAAGSRCAAGPDIQA
jgi:hypothetical protein